MPDPLDAFSPDRPPGIRVIRLISETIAIMVRRLNCPVPRAAAILRGILNFYGIYVFAPLPETMQAQIHPPLPPLLSGTRVLLRLPPPPAASRRSRRSSFCDSDSDMDD